MNELKVIYNLNPIPISLTGVIYVNPYPYLPPTTMYVPVGSGILYKAVPSLWNVFIIQEKTYTNNEVIIRETVTITPSSGGIILFSAEPIQASVYSISGQMVFQKSFTGRLEIPLPSGIYIVKTNNITKKVFVMSGGRRN